MATFLAVLALSGAATIGAWFAGTSAARPEQARLSYLDAAADSIALKAVESAAPAVGAPAPSPARAPRAIGVSNGSYDTRHDGVDFVVGTPAGAAAPFSLRFLPASVTCAGDLISGGAIGEYDVANGGFEAKRGAVAERYMYDTNRVEQLVVIDEKPAVAGEIVVTSGITLPDGASVEVESGLWRDARFTHGGLRIVDGTGSEIAAIYGARVIDAVGRQLDLPIAWVGGAMKIRVPESFVALAQFPLTVDPWIELALSGTSGVIGTASGAFRQVSLALSPAGAQYVALSDAGLDIDVRTFSTATSIWVDVGALAPFTTVASSIEPAITCPTGSAAPFVAWREDVGVASEIHARQFIAGAWIEIFGSATGGGISATAGAESGTPSVAIDSAGNQYVAWSESAGGVFEIYVKRNLGAGWVEVGGSATGAGVSGTAGLNTSRFPRIVIDGLDRPVVAWWETVGGSEHIYVRRLEAGVWVELAASGSGTGISASGISVWPDVTFDATNQPIVAWQETAPTLEIYAKRYDGAAWVDMAGSGSGTGISGTPGLADDVPVLGRDSLGNPVVAWNADTGAPAGNQIFVKRWTGFAWNQIEGSATAPTGISGAASPNFSPSIAVDSAGRPRVAWWHVPTGFALYREYQGLALPTAISQTRVGGTPILVGGATPESSVRFTGTVVSSSAGEEARLQIEVKPIGTPFAGVPTAESPFTPAGSTAELTIPLAAGTYHWQARFESLYTGAPRSVWASFPLPPAGNPEAATDFSVGIAPAAPASVELTQHHLDTGVLLPDGGSTLSGGIIFRYTPTVALPEDLRLQVDFTGDGIVDVESPLNPSGSTTAISISVPLALGGYDWTARLTNAAGLSSGLTAFETGGGTDFTVAAAPPPVAPAVPTLVDQFRLDGTTIIAAAGTTPEGAVVLRATTPAGSPGDLFRVQFEVAPTGGLTGVPDAESVLVPPLTTVSVTIPLTDGAYEWQARTQSSAFLTSAFVLFGGAGLDFNVDTPAAGPPPAAPGTLGQFMLDGTTGIAFGGSTPEGAAVFRATLPASTDMLRLQIEVVPEASAFTGLPSAESPLVPGGSTVSISYPLGAGSWKWQARSISSSLATSAFVEFSPATPGPDLVVTAAPSLPPAAPTVMGQENLDGSAIASGGTAATDTVVFEVTVPGLASALNRIQIDVELTGFGLDGVPDVESPLVAGGSIVNVAVPLSSGSYNWAARTMGSTGLASAYTLFAGGPPDFNVVAAAAPVAPTVPVTLVQRNLDGTVIAAGGTSTGPVVVFEVVVPGAAAELNRIQVDFAPIASALDLNPNVESPLVAGGSTVQIAVPFGIGSYNWAARTQSSFGLNSAYTAFAGGPPDFVVVTGGAAPAAPTVLAQENPDTSAIGTGGTAAGSIVVFEVLVPGAATDLNRIQVDVETAGGLDGIPDVDSPLVAGGTVVTISVPFADASYDWQARTQSVGGAVSGFTPFSGASPDFVIFTGTTPPAAPSAPVTLVQRNLDASVIASGGTAAGSVVVFEAIVPGLVTDLNRIQVSWAAGAPDLIPEVESPLVAGGSTVTMSVPFSPGSYNWQARTVSSFDLFSGYTAFAGGPPDFVVAVGGAAPAAPLAAAMAQLNPDASAIASGGTAAGSIVVFSVSVPGAATDLNRIQVDVEVGAPDGTPDVESPLVSGGTTVTISVPFANGLYNWQARTQSSSGAVSAYTPFPGGPDDFEVDTTTPPPAAPTAPVAATMDQQNLDGSSIVLGGTSTGSSVRFVVGVPGVPADLNRIQVDYATGALDGLPEVESPLVPGGSVVVLTVSLGNGSYDWQARTQSSFGLNSGFTPFDVASPDFVVAAGGAAPPVTSGLSQTNPGGSVIAVGGTSATNVVVFGGTVSTTPAGGTARLQVEFSTAGFTGVPDVESPLVPDGTSVSIAVPLGDGSYNWQARTQSSGGATSAYTSFDPSTPDFVVLAGAGGAPPSVPTGLAQRRLDGTVILPGGSTAGGSVIFEGTVGGVPGTMGRLQVEYTPVGFGFTGVPDVDSPLVLVGTVVQITVPLTTGTFEWQARTQSSTGATSAFVEFAAGAVIDFTVPAAGTGSAPADPIALTQLRLDGVTAIASGGTTDENAVTFRATLPGAAIDLNRLLVEYVDSIIGTFSGNPSVESPLVPGGATVSIAIPIADGSYMWRARSQSSTTAASAWVDFGAAAGTDFIVSTGGVAPPAPTGLSQTNPGGSLIGLGATATTDVVVFGATVTAAIPGELVRLQIDFAPVGGLSGTPDVESPLVPSGTLVSIAVPLGDGGYEWQARTLAASGAAGAYAEFGGTSGVTPDFLVSAGAGGIAPSAPTGLAQRRLDGTLIAGGGTTSGDTVVYEGVVSGPAGSFLRLEVEFALFGTGLAGVPDVESPLVPTGSTVQIEVAHGDGSYEWQARARTSTGAVSGFSAFGGSSGVAADFVVAAGSGGVPPAPPTGIGQFRIDGISAVPAGGIVADDKIMFRGTLPGPAALLVRLQVEYVDSAGAFFGNPVVESPLVPGSSTVSISVPIADGSFMWRARSQSSTGASSGWIDFAAAAGTDFTIASAGLTPPVPTGLAQESLSGSPIPSGGTTFSDTVVFRSTVFAPGGVGLVKMQVEFAPTSSLSGIPDAESPLVPSGTSVTLAIPIGDGSYEWQARTVSPTGLASAFVPFGGTTGVTDFIVSAGSGGPTPAIPSGLAQLRLDGSLIPAGGTTSGDTVVFEGLVTGASGSFLRLQVEFSLIGGGFTGIPDVESVLVPTGSFVRIAVPLGDGSYEWQARTQSSLGAVSAFTLFGAPGTDFVVASSIGGTPPGPPSALEQRTIAGALVPSGGTVTDDTIVFRGTVPGTSSDLNRMQVEYVVLPTVFTGVPSVESPLVPGGSVVSIVVPVADGSYGWQARAQSSLGGSSPYLSFGLVADVDFIIASTGIAPTSPTGLFQEDLAGVPVALAATLFDDTIVLGGTVTTPIPGDTARIQVEIRSLALFSGVPDVESPLVPDGSVVSIAVPLADGAYSWQARTRTSLGAVSPFVAFDPSSPHFIIDGDGGVVPPAPTALDQTELDLTPIPVGGTVFDQNVVFSGIVTTADATLVRLQIDYTPITGTPDLETLLLPTGSLASLTIALPDGVYDWSARTVTSKGVASAWTPFSGGTPDFIVDADQSTNPPATPTALDQLDETLTPVPVGGTVFNDDITFTGVVPGLATDLIRLQVEFADTGVLFNGAVDIDSPLMPGGSTVSILVPFGAGSYHWRARSQRSVGVSSAWVEFGGNPTTLTDFIVVTNPGGPTPPVPTSLEQLFSPDNIIPLGELIEEHDMIFQGLVTGIPGELLRLQVEVQVIGLPFTSAPSFESALVAPGTLTQIHQNLPKGFYHWRARTISSTGAISPWVSFGANSDGEMDFGLESTGQYDDDDKGGFRQKVKKKCGLIGLEVFGLFLLAGLAGRAVRRVRRKSA
ncbi:MAG: hypothetical protein HUU15_03985 [Candidatus Brocadiae bacterium]|nr:hypothetical protein [Candidatus Brocadiia bacterium]